MKGPGRRDLKIVEMEEDDIPEILEIENRCFKSPWTKNLFKEEYDLGHSKVFVAKKPVTDDTSIVGYLCFWLVIDEAHVLKLATHPDFRRHGIATRLISFCLEASIRAGAGEITLEVRESNLPALALYKRFGFKAKGIRRRYYSDSLEDAIIMWLRLDGLLPKQEFL